MPNLFKQCVLIIFSNKTLYTYFKSAIGVKSSNYLIILD